MGYVPVFLIFVPITVFLALTVMFGNPDTTPALTAVEFIQNSSSLFDRQACIDAYADCSNDGCSFFTGSFTEWPTFHLCGDLFYVLNAIGRAIAIPAVSVAVPFLLMVGPTSVTILGQTVTLLTNVYYQLTYAVLWAMFGLGVFLVIW